MTTTERICPPQWPKWPFVDSTDGVLAAMRDVLDSSVWTTRAPGREDSATQWAEAEIARQFEVRHALLVTSGTVAVELAIRALDLAPGSKVIVPALGWFATAAAVIRAGAIPVFADVSLETSCLDPDSVSRCIDPDVRAIVAVHLHCAVADLDNLASIARKHGLELIEDCAQVPGTRYGGKPVGSIGRMGCFSFNQEKLIAVGEGGCVVTNDGELFQRLYALRTDGYVNRETHGRAFVPHGSVRGGNACPSEFSAILVLAQMKQFPRLNAKRREVAEKLDAQLADIDGVYPLSSSPGTSDRTWFEYAFRLDLRKFGGRTIRQCGGFLSSELRLPIHATDEPTQDCPMLHLARCGRPTPTALALYNTMLVFHHRALLDERIAREFPDALRRLQDESLEARRTGS